MPLVTGTFIHGKADLGIEEDIIQPKMIPQQMTASSWTQFE